MDNGSQPSRDLLGAFLEKLMEDVESKNVGPLETYQKEFSGNDAIIARAYETIVETGNSDDTATTVRTQRTKPTEKEGCIGQYKLLDLLGRGGQGSVYLAEDTTLKRKVAIKILESRGEPSEEQLRRYRREAEIASRLDHKGICTVYDTDFECAEPHIVMQYVEGKSLSQHINAAREGSVETLSTLYESLDGSITDLEKEPLPDPPSATSTVGREQVLEAIRLIEETARALHVAHESNVVHRDIKPANIMVANDGTPVILDFGLARNMDDDNSILTRPGDFFGTVAYMSPEQLLSTRVELDRRSDIYSLGVSLYELVTLERPFTAPTTEATILAIQSEEPISARQKNRSVPVDLNVVIATAMDKARSRRYQTALELAEDLRRVREHKPIRARPAGPILKLRRWAQRKPALATATGLLFVFLAVGLSVTTWFAHNLDTAVTDYERLGDEKLIRDLVSEAEALWPAGPNLVGKMERWIEKSDRLSVAVKGHQDALQSLRESEGQLDQKESADSPDVWVFQDEALQWRHDQLAELITKLETFLSGSLVEEMRRRVAFARTIQQRSIDDHKDLWDATVSAVSRDKRFQAYELRPQLGLVPLGSDPDTSLQEFACLSSGSIPTRNAKSGKLQINEATGIVFVLVPGGWFNMGAQSEDKDKPNYDPQAKFNENPVHGVSLAPFMMSKYEATQAQWTAMSGGNPSAWKAGETKVGTKITLLHPVESISNIECVQILRNHRMVLPTEARWEYACRAGTHTPWYCGSNYLDLDGYANLADEGSKMHYTSDFDWDPKMSDGYALHAPVGSFEPNSFGLHDAHGNVFEWCLETMGQYHDSQFRSGDGLNVGSKSDSGLIRGGGFKRPAESARSASRYKTDLRVGYMTLGVRPVWPLTSQ